MSDRIRVVIADDHPLFRGGLEALLGSVPDVEVVGEATTGEEAVEVVRALLPDVVVMDLTMPGIGGIEATRRVLAAAPGVHVLVMTMHEDDDTVFAALRAGAHGYVLKGSQQAETLRAIRGVANGEAILGPPVAERLQRFLTVPQVADPADAFPQLTERELDVLEQLAQRRTNAEIAVALFLTPKTVRNYVSGILAKLQVADRAEARQLARAAGIGGPAAPGQAPRPAPAPGRPRR